MRSIGLKLIIAMILVSILLVVLFFYDRWNRRVRTPMGTMSYVVDKSDDAGRWEKVAFAKRSPQLEMPKRSKEFLEKYPPAFYEMELNQQTKTKIIIDQERVAPGSDVMVEVLFQDTVGECINVGAQLEIGGVIIGSASLKLGLDANQTYNSNQELFKGTIHVGDKAKLSGANPLIKVIRSFRASMDKSPEKFRLEAYEIPAKIKSSAN